MICCTFLESLHYGRNTCCEGLGPSDPIPKSCNWILQDAANGPALGAPEAGVRADPQKRPMKELTALPCNAGDEA